MQRLDLTAAQAANATPVANRRDARLDMFRGIALVMIFINHVPGTVYELGTSRNFGFSDAAEGFVFMSGMAAGLAYSGAFRNGAFWLGALRIWARARQLYFVHLTITLITLALFAAAALWFAMPEVLTKNNIAGVFQQPLGVMIGIPTLGHQLGYLNILPLYFVLLLVTPFIIVSGLRWPWVTLALSVAVWLTAGVMQFNIPNYPLGGGWFFNPFSWQVLFVIGLLSGMAMKRGESLVPFHPVLFGVAAAFVIFVLLWARIPELAVAGRGVLEIAADAGAPSVVVWFNKAYLALPRLLHALALFYVLSSIPAVQRFASTALASPFRLLGRQALPVFATGTVISMVLQLIKTDRAPDPLFDGVILAIGLAAQLGLAFVLTRIVAARAQRRKA
jgi:hypothetical protein